MFQAFKDLKKNVKTSIRRQSIGKLPKRASQHATYVGRRFSRLTIVREALVLDEYKDVDPTKFVCKEYTFNGNFSAESKGKVSKVLGNSITEAIAMFRAKPEIFVALLYPTEMMNWPENEQQYTLVHRAGTVGFEPRGISPNGKVTLLVNEYQPLPAFPNDELPPNARDQYTDTVLAKYNGKPLGKPMLPGRGMGLVDEPNITILDKNMDPDPSAVAQGPQVGDCWLLSGIATLAEFDGTIRHLFRKTPQIEQMPFEDGRPNLYTVSLWDLTTWTEVEIVVDERLCAQARPNNDANAYMKLQGAKPSRENELWVCYLEKALAAHCGGWDKINGGYVTHSWALLTGNKEQYIIQKDKSGKKFGCWAKYDTTKRQFRELANSPLEGPQGMSKAPWPKVGAIAGKDETDDLTPEELFAKMCAWDDENYLIGCASGEASFFKRTVAGIVDNHAYGVVEVRDDVAGTGVDMIQVRNPWGKGEGATKGMFRDKGPGWRKYPAIKKELNPIASDDGLFWVTKEEFFKFYEVVYLSAFNMTTFFGPRRSSKKLSQEDDPALQANATAPNQQVVQPQQPIKVVATFTNTGRDPSFSAAELYYESTRFGPLGQGDPPIAVETYQGHRWFLVANGIYAKQFDIGANAQQVFQF